MRDRDLKQVSSQWYIALQSMEVVGHSCGTAEAKKKRGSLLLGRREGRLLPPRLWSS